MSVEQREQTPMVGVLEGTEWVRGRGREDVKEVTGKGDAFLFTLSEIGVLSREVI